MRMKCAAPSAPEMNYLVPEMRQVSPTFSARVRIMLGSEPEPGTGPREHRAHLAVDDGLQLTRFLRLGGDLVQHDHVAVVGRGAVEDGHVLGNDRQEGGRPDPPGSKGNRM
jgi:hypothetical protein